MKNLLIRLLAWLLEVNPARLTSHREQLNLTPMDYHCLKEILDIIEYGEGRTIFPNAWMGGQAELIATCPWCGYLKGHGHREGCGMAWLKEKLT